MKLTSMTIPTGLSAALAVAFLLTSACWAGGGDGDSPYNMPRNFNGGGSDGNDDGGSSNSEQQKAVVGPSRDAQRGPTSTDTEPTQPGAEKLKELNKKTTTVPVTVQPGGSFWLAKALDVHAAKVQVSGAKLKNPSQTPTIFSGNAGSSQTAGGAGGAAALGLTVGSGDSTVAKHLVLGFQAQGTFALNAGNAKVTLTPPASTPTAFATVSLGTIDAGGVFQPESMTVVTVQASGFDLSALAAQWSGVAAAAGKTVQVEIAASGVHPIATARFAAGVVKPTLYVSTEP